MHLSCGGAFFALCQVTRRSRVVLALGSKAMARRKKRIDRKLHQRYLDLGVVDASQSSSWRRHLFSAPMHDKFVIDSRNVEGIPTSVARAIRRFGLSYFVCRVSQGESTFIEPDWDGFCFFQFQARRYPDIVAVSANNPDVI